MLRPEYRLKKKYQFNYVYRVGKTCHGKFVLLVFSSSKNQNVKIGISVSKKIGNAVMRNRARRLIREAVGEFASSIKKNYNIVLVAKQAINGLKKDAVASDILMVLKKADLLNEKSVSSNS